MDSKAQSQRARQVSLEQGISEAYATYRNGLLKYCGYVLGDREAAAEIVQESFLRLIELVGKQQAPSEARDWLFICARNLCFSRMRKARSQAQYELLNFAPAENVDVESKTFINQVLARLDSEERDLILMREQQQYSIREIAGIIGVSEEAVRVRLHRVRKKMQELGVK